jgi:predicted permease
MFDALVARVRSVLRRDTVAREMEEELRQHLDESTDLLIRRGISPDEARLAAKQAMGSRTVIAEDARDARGARALDDVRRDVQYALRALARTPWFTVVVVITLALSFGVNGAIFAVLKRAMSPTSIPDARTWLEIPDHWSWEDYQRISTRTTTMTDWSASANEVVLLGADTRDQDPQTIRAEFVTDGFLPSLRARAALGRAFSPAEVAPPIGIPVAVLSHSLWRRRFNSDSSIIGRPIRLADGQPFEVIGVMPQTFTGSSLRPPDVWLPLGTRARLPDTDDMRGTLATNWFGPTGRRYIFLHARLAQGTSLSAARAELRLRIDQIAVGDSNRGRDVSSYMHPATQSGINGPDEFAGVALVLGAAMSVLLIASVTVANLMLARAAARRREMGVRLALGASRGRVLRSWMTECFVLSLLAAVVGLAIASWTVRAIVLGPTFTSLVKDGDPLVLAAALAPDASVFVYLVLISIPSTLVFGLVPALRATRDDPLTTMRAGANSTGSTSGVERVYLRRGLVISQIALTTVLLLASAMMVRGVDEVSRVDPGFNRHDVIAVSPTLVHSGYDSVRAGRFMEEFLGRLGTIPGVRQVTRGDVPMENTPLALVTRPNENVPSETEWNGSMNAVSENYFEALDLEIVRGRTFTRAEVLNSLPVVVISQRTAETLWPDQEPIGKVISVKILDAYARTALKDGRFDQARVVGVVQDAQMTGVGLWPRRYVYVPSDHGTPMLRTNGDPQVATRVRALTRQIDPNVIVTVRTLEEAIWASSGWLESAKLITNSAAGMGILSLLMAVVGLFGLTAYAVEQRTREFGVRMALGAGAASVLRLVTGQSLRMVAIGGAIGLLAGMAMGGILRSQLLGASANSWPVFVLVVSLLAFVSILACVIPAWRATRVDPLVALRTD